MKLLLRIILLVVSLCSATFIADINGQEQTSTPYSNKSTVYSVSIVDTCNYKFKRAQYTMFIPKGISRVRGILIHQHGCTMEGTGKPITTDLQYQAFAKKWDLAIIGPDMYPQGNDCFEWNSPENGSDASLLKGIDSLSILSGHPELTDAPWLLWGHSGGGHWVLSMLSKHPQKVIALVAYSAAFDPKFNYPASVAKVPVLLRHAGKDDINEPPVKCWETAVNQFSTLRKMKGLASIVHNKNQTHNFSYIRRLTIPFFESVLQQRLPADESNLLRDMDYSKSWLADTTGIKIYKASTFMGNHDSMSWLPDSITARKYQEFIQSGTILDHTLPPTPYHVIIKKQNRQGIKITWEADADIESGIKYFNIYKNGKFIQRFPAEGDYQYFDTNGDNPIPEIAPQMCITLPQTDIISNTDIIEITTVNYDGLESLKTRGNITLKMTHIVN